jgi:hypothetical protein
LLHFIGHIIVFDSENYGEKRTSATRPSTTFRLVRQKKISRKTLLGLIVTAALCFCWNSDLDRVGALRPCVVSKRDGGHESLQEFGRRASLRGMNISSARRLRMFLKKKFNP